MNYGYIPMIISTWPLQNILKVSSESFHRRLTPHFTIFTAMSTPNIPFELPTSPLPPINWATKPKQTTATVTIDGRRLCIIIDLADFDQPGLRLANNPNHSLPVRQELNMLNLNQLKEELVSQGGTRRTHDIPSHLSRSSEDLSSNLSHLSMTATSFSQRSLAPTASPTNRKKKYYVVTVGKCAGVFFNYWYVYCFDDF
jgi:hypothetical protein